MEKCVSPEIKVYLLNYRGLRGGSPQTLVTKGLFRLPVPAADLDCVHTMPADVENDEKSDGSKI